MFLIFGVNPIKKTGPRSIRRHCPRCNDLRNFRELTYRSYLSFFFIPILPISRATTFFSCSSCNYTVTGESADDTLPIVDSPNSPENADDTTPKIIIFCSRCDGAMTIPARSFRQTVTCPHCTLEFVVKGIKNEIPPAITVPHN